MEPRHFVFATGRVVAENGTEILGESELHPWRGDWRSVRAVSSKLSWAEDFLRLARAVFLVDRRVPRETSSDRWTRDLRLTVELHDPGRWTTAVLTRLNWMLRVLTSDHWEVHVRGGAVATGRPPLCDTGSPIEVMLFSGGLDSTVYAAMRARERGGRLLLVGHDLGGARQGQEAMLRVINEKSGPACRRPAEARLVGDRLGARAEEGSEPSARTRGLLFAAHGVRVAAAHRASWLAVPENGQLAINPPLTPARAAALSHRSAHPYILAEINRLIRELHGTVRLHNPFQRHTKGDVCATGLDSGLRAEELAETVSCACRPARAGRVNCGWCYPCLVRRSGLQEAIGYDPSRYASSLDRLVSERSRQDLWDLQRWLSRRYTMRDLLADVPLPAEIDPQDVLATLRRGRRELARMLRRHDQWVELAE